MSPRHRAVGQCIKVGKYVGNIGSYILEQDGFEGLGAGILGSNTVVLFLGVVRQVRRIGCRDPWLFVGVVRHLPVLRFKATSSHPSRSQHPGS